MGLDLKNCAKFIEREAKKCILLRSSADSSTKIWENKFFSPLIYQTFFDKFLPLISLLSESERQHKCWVLAENCQIFENFKVFCKVKQMISWLWFHVPFLWPILSYKWYYWYLTIYFKKFSLVKVLPFYL